MLIFGLVAVIMVLGLALMISVIGQYAAPAEKQPIKALTNMGTLGLIAFLNPGESQT